MQDWLIFAAGLTASICLAESGTVFEVPGWVTTIGPWGVMYFVIDRLTSGHTKALAEIAANVNRLTAVIAKVEGIKLEETSTKEESK